MQFRHHHCQPSLRETRSLSCTRQQTPTFLEGKSFSTPVFRHPSIYVAHGGMSLLQHGWIVKYLDTQCRFAPNNVFAILKKRLFLYYTTELEEQLIGLIIISKWWAFIVNIKKYNCEDSLKIKRNISAMRRQKSIS